MRFVFCFGFQFNDWEVEVEIPKEYRFPSMKMAQKAGREMEVKIIIFPQNIVVFMEHEYMVLDEYERYHFWRIRKDVYEMMGVPLSPEDISELIEKDTLDEVRYSGRYMVQESDFEKLDITINQAYQLLLEKYEPQQELPFGFGYQPLKNVKGFPFSCLYFQAKESE